MSQPLLPCEFNRYQIVAVLKNGQELLVSLGQSESEARWYYSQQLEELVWLKILCFVLREWRALPVGGYWKSVSTWRASSRRSYGLAV